MIDNEPVLEARILSWKYEEIERRVAKLYEEQNINKLPIDPFEIINKKGYMLLPFSKLKKGTRPECVDENSDAFSFFHPVLKTSVIVYNDDKPLRRIRFTLMHEVGHIDLGKFSSEESADIAATFDVSYDCAEICSCRYQNWQQYGVRYLKDYEIKMISLFN